MKKTIAGGVWPVMITPYREDTRIDYDAVLRSSEWYDKNGVDGIFAVCQSSEMFELSPQERVELAKFIINNTPKHMGVIASGHCAEKAEDQIREALTVIDAGVDAYVFFSNQFAKQMSVKMVNVNQFVSELSGGNKQKVVLARWIGKDSDIVVLDSPTRGIDIKVKQDIYQLMNQMRKNGKSIIMISEELMELIGMCDRIIIMKDGKISGELERDEAMDENSLITMMV